MVARRTRGIILLRTHVSMVYCAPIRSTCILGAPVPSKIRPDDWDRLFAPNAPRRGGPLRALMTIMVTVAGIGLLGGGTLYGLNFREQRFAQAAATATALAPTAAAIRTATALVEQQATATLVAALTA